MKKNIYIFFLIILISITSISCSSENISDIDNTENENIGSQHTVRYTPSKGTSTNDTNKDIKLSAKTNSGPVSVLPWEDDLNFQEALSKYNTPVLMGGFRTILLDPLPGEEYNVHLAAKSLSGKVIKPGEIFSQNQSIGPYTEPNGYKEGPTYVGGKVTTTVGGGVCKIASTLYNVAILSNLEIVERHNHGMPVPYVPYGQDATVAYGAKDIRFRNNTDSSILIWSMGIDNTLYIAFYGNKKPPEIRWNHETLYINEAPKTYNINPDLPKGTEKIVSEGMDGGAIESWITIIKEDGTEEKKHLGKSIYKPMPHIFEKN